MNAISSRVVNDFIHLLTELSQMKSNQFSGAGFVLYYDLTILSQYHCNLVNDGTPQQPFKLGSSELNNYLIEISKYNHPYHDGFHFINGEGILTHVAQFFSPPVDKKIFNIFGQGARTYCSQCGSTVDGVLMVGSVSTNRSIYIFENGKLVDNKLVFKAA